jgi:hypothetical protein
MSLIKYLAVVLVAGCAGVSNAADIPKKYMRLLINDPKPSEVVGVNDLIGPFTRIEEICGYESKTTDSISVDYDEKHRPIRVIKLSVGSNVKEDMLFAYRGNKLVSSKKHTITPKEDFSDIEEYTYDEDGLLRRSLYKSSSGFVNDVDEIDDLRNRVIAFKVDAATGNFMVFYAAMQGEPAVDVLYDKAGRDIYRNIHGQTLFTTDPRRPIIKTNIDQEFSYKYKIDINGRVAERLQSKRQSGAFLEIEDETFNERGWSTSKWEASIKSDGSYSNMGNFLRTYYEVDKVGNWISFETWKLDKSDNRIENNKWCRRDIKYSEKK